MKKLGEGSYSKVKLAIKNDTAEKFAIKMFKKSILRKKKEYIREEKGSFLIINSLLYLYIHIELHFISEYIYYLLLYIYYI